MFCVVLLRARRGEARYLAAMASAVSAVFGLISIDGSSLKLLSSAFIRVMDGALGCYYASLSTGYESGIRVTGIFGILLHLHMPLQYLIMMAISFGVSFAVTWVICTPEAEEAKA